MPNQISLVEIVALLKAASPDTEDFRKNFARLYELLYDPLIRYSKKLCRSSPITKGREIHEDFVHDALLKFLQYLNNYNKDRGSVLTYTARIVSSLFLNHIMGKKNDFISIASRNFIIQKAHRCESRASC